MGWLSRLGSKVVSVFRRKEPPKRMMGVHAKDVLKRKKTMLLNVRVRLEKTIALGKDLIPRLNKFSASLEAGCTQKNLDLWRHTFLGKVLPVMQNYFDNLNGVKHSPYLNVNVGKPMDAKRKFTASAQTIVTIPESPEFKRKVLSLIHHYSAEMAAQVDNMIREKRRFLEEMAFVALK